jgi:FMN-dependent NADH-azoreductase
MSTLLHLDTSPLETSVSRELGREHVAAWKADHPNGTVIYRDLAAKSPAAIDQAWIGASFTPPDARTAEQKAHLAESEALVDELLAADEIAIGVPMHNFTIPAALKLWIDQIVRPGRTFSYGGNGAEGLLKGRTATLLIATGGDYALGTPAAAMNFLEPYMRTLLGFIGITDVRTHTVGSVAKLMTGAVDRETLLLPALTRIRAAVSAPPPYSKTGPSHGTQGEIQ